MQVLGDRTGVHFTTISDIENGHHRLAPATPFAGFYGCSCRQARPHRVSEVKRRPVNGHLAYSASLGTVGHAGDRSSMW